MLNNLTARVKKYQQDLINLRRDLHQIPEVGLCLPQTQARLLQELEGLPLEIHLGKSLSSIVAILRGNKRPTTGVVKTVLLRGDMDALPVKEQTGLSFASTNGNMHACGHDLHMSTLVGAVKILCDNIADIEGDIVFMFQPGEEGCDGAQHMLDEGLLELAGNDILSSYAIHVFSSGEQHGIFASRVGTMMSASCSLDVKIIGKGGHGSAPHTALDPIPVMAQIITELQVLIARSFNIFDPVVLTVGHVWAGQARNVIPEFANFEGTVRVFSEEAWQRASDLIPKLIKGIAQSNGMQAEVNLNRVYPITQNNDFAHNLVRTCVTELFGSQRFLNWEHSMAASEDFSKVLDKTGGAFIYLSAVPPHEDAKSTAMNHSAYAIFDDSVLADAALLMATLAVKTINI